MSNTLPVILVDGSSYLYRAFHALPPLTGAEGQPTGAIYGVANMLRRLIKDYSPTHMAVVFDPKGKTFRDDLYPEYKANRPPMPDDLRVQVEPLFELIKAMGLPLIIVEGVEADDVIGTLAQQAKAQKVPVIISTGDKDMAQLVNEHIHLINTMTHKTLDIPGVLEKFGVNPAQIIDYLTLMGDSVDNIPGVEKVGPKTAVKWLAQYDTLDNIIAHADEFKGKVGEHLRKALPKLPLSKQLATIKLDVELPLDLSNCHLNAPDNAALVELLKQLQFQTWLGELSAETSAETPEKNYETIFTREALAKWITRLQGAKYWAFDTETTGLDIIDAECVGVSFSCEAHEGAYVPLAHDYEGAPTQLGLTEVLAALKPLLEDPKQIKIAQNAKYDISIFKKYGIHPKGVVFDTMLESYLLRAVTRGNDMDSLALKYLNVQTVHFEDIAGKGAKQLTFNQIPLEKAAPYAAEDADITLQLHQTLWPKLKDLAGPRQVFEKVEMPLVDVLSDMQLRGVLIDVPHLNQLSEKFAIEITTLEKEAHGLVGETFNLASPAQLQAILYEKMQLPVLKKTPKGQPSTAEEVLQTLALDYPLPKLILRHRTVSKLKSTYTDKLPKVVKEKTGRVHTSYHQAGTATGRLSSSDPNLQNIPARTEEGRDIRKAFIAPKGYKILAADYSQIELRIMAHFSKDENLLKAFEQGWDIHAATASEIFHINLEDVTSVQRRDAKVINFGLLYGMSAFGLSKQLNISRGAAGQYIETYFARFPKVREYTEQTRIKAHETGYVETLLGRRLYLPEINAQNKARQQAAERAAVNAPLQGSAADLIKLAMIALHESLQTQAYDAYMVMQVHDELVLEVKEDCLEAVKALVEEKMTQALTLSIPLEVAIGIADNWADAH